MVEGEASEKFNCFICHSCTLPFPALCPSPSPPLKFFPWPFLISPYLTISSYFSFLIWIMCQCFLGSNGWFGFYKETPLRTSISNGCCMFRWGCGRLLWLIMAPLNSSFSKLFLSYWSSLSLWSSMVEIFFPFSLSFPPLPANCSWNHINFRLS